MGKLKTNTRISAATLIETIIAMVIILTIFGIVTSVLVQSSIGYFSLSKMKATQMINEYAGETNDQKAFFDETIERNGFRITREINMDALSNTIKIKFGVYNSDDRLVNYQYRIVSMR